MYQFVDNVKVGKSLTKLNHLASARQFVLPGSADTIVICEF